MSDISIWQQVIKKELKIDQVERFLRKELPEGGFLSLLETAAPDWYSPSNRPPALSCSWTDSTSDLSTTIPELMKVGVWDFIFDPQLMGINETQLHQKLSGLSSTDARIWPILHWKNRYPQGCVPVISASEVHSIGGHAVHELAFILDELIQWAQSKPTSKIGIAIHCDNEFFKSIAKIRALKAITLAMLKELGSAHLFESITWIGRSSWREFTAFDSGSNILRNATALSAAYIGGVDVVESLPYDLLIESSTAINERAQRLSLTSQLVLQQESFLGEVSDASSGSFSIEALTRTLGENAWSLMQELQGLDDKISYLKPKIDEHWAQVRNSFNTRKLLQTGVNDFPDASEKVLLKEKFKNSPSVRLAEGFEGLRIAMQRLKPIKVAVVVAGDYAALNARLSFTKNFFELLGLQVIESENGIDLNQAQDWLDQSNTHVWAIVAADSDHGKIKITSKKSRIYLAGKTKLEGIHNIYSGVDVYHALAELLKWGSSL